MTSPRKKLACTRQKVKIDEFNKSSNLKIRDCVGDSELGGNKLSQVGSPGLELFEGNEFESVLVSGNIEAGDYTPETLYNCISANVLLPHGIEQMRRKTTVRAKDKDGLPIGRMDLILSWTRGI